MRLKTLLLMLVTAVMALSLSACGSSDEATGDGGSGGGSENGGSENGSSGGEEQSRGGETQQEATEEAAEVPEDKSLKVTVPKMQNMDNAEVPNATYDDEQALKENAAIHVDSTGYPWEEESNTYLAGHALGFENTPSWHAFRDLDNLEEGDEIYVEDANGKEYTYEVFRESFDVEPTQVEVIQPQEGRNILSLQSCTLPDYEDRVIVQAELKEA